MADPGRAIECFEPALAIRRRIGEIADQRQTISGLAAAHEDLNDRHAAQDLLIELLWLDEQLDHPELEADRARLERIGRLATT